MKLQKIENTKILMNITSYADFKFFNESLNESLTTDEKEFFKNNFSKYYKIISKEEALDLLGAEDYIHWNVGDTPDESVGTIIAYLWATPEYFQDMFDNEIEFAYLMKKGNNIYVAVDDADDNFYPIEPSCLRQQFDESLLTEKLPADIVQALKNKNHHKLGDLAQATGIDLENSEYNEITKEEAKDLLKKGERNFIILGKDIPSNKNDFLTVLYAPFMPVDYLSPSYPYRPVGRVQAITQAIKDGEKVYIMKRPAAQEDSLNEDADRDAQIAKKCDECWDSLVSNNDEIHLYDYEKIKALQENFRACLVKNGCDLSYRKATSPKYGFSVSGNADGICSSYIINFTTNQWKDCSMTREELEEHLKKDIKTYKSARYFSVQEISKEQFMDISFGSNSRHVGYGSQSSVHVESTELKQDKFGNLLAQHSYMIWDSLNEEAETPAEEPAAETTPVAEKDQSVLSFSEAINGLTQQYWDIISYIKSLVVMLKSEEAQAAFNKEDVITILNTLSDDTTIGIGMLAKASEIIDNNTQVLMTMGTEKAEEIVSEPASTDLK